jgi:hypothetical protein
MTTTQAPQRGESGWTPDPYHNALAQRAEEIRRDLIIFLERNPDLTPGQAGKLVSIAGRASIMADYRWLEALENAWRR